MTNDDRINAVAVEFCPHAATDAMLDAVDEIVDLLGDDSDFEPDVCDREIDYGDEPEWADDWDGSKADDGPEDTPADLIGDEDCVSLFMAPDVAERELQRVLEKKIPSHRRRCGWSWRSDSVGVLHGRRVRVMDLRRDNNA